MPLTAGRSRPTPSPRSQASHQVQSVGQSHDFPGLHYAQMCELDQESWPMHYHLGCARNREVVNDSHSSAMLLCRWSLSHLWHLSFMPDPTWIWLIRQSTGLVPTTKSLAIDRSLSDLPMIPRCIWRFQISTARSMHPSRWLVRGQIGLVPHQL